MAPASFGGEQKKGMFPDFHFGMFGSAKRWQVRHLDGEARVPQTQAGTPTAPSGLAYGPLPTNESQRARSAALPFCFQARARARGLLEEEPTRSRGPSPCSSSSSGFDLFDRA